MSDLQHLERDITFFANGPVRKEALEPVIEEASRRGYSVSITDNLSAEAEIGVYNDHTDRIEEVNSKLSCIMFHSIDCSYKERHWMREHWDSFDIGFVIGEVAASNWQSQSSFPKARPSIGVFSVGWPKGDKAFTDEFKNMIQQERDERDLYSNPTIIYAPSGSTSDKQKLEELLNAIKQIDYTANLLIRQHPSVKNPVPDGLVERVEENDRIHLLDQSRDIIECIALSDILISEESSVLLEAVLVNTIPISVVDWPIVRGRQKKTKSVKTIPETAIRTSRENLPNTLEEVINDLDTILEQIIGKRERNFSNVGKSSSVTMDIIDAYVDDEAPPMEPVESHESLTANIYWKLKITPTNFYQGSRKRVVNSMSDRTKEKLKKLKLDKAILAIDDLFDYK